MISLSRREIFVHIHPMDLQHALDQRARVQEFTRKHRVGLLTLLFTDLVGSTKLKQDLGDQEAVKLIQGHHDLVRGILSRFAEGEEIGTAGDSFFIIFAKPSDGVKFAVILQSELRRLGRGAARSLKDRVGVHIGEVLIEERTDLAKTKDLYGLQVDICARVMSLAEGDQILLTRSVFDNARQVLKGQEIQGMDSSEGLQWLNHGPYLLKGVEEPLEICEVGETGKAVLKPPPDSDKTHRHISPDNEPVLGWRPALDQFVPNTKWRLEAKLGEGAVGEVWLGRHETLKEARVFKFCFQIERVRALKREVTLFRLLKERIGTHPGIVDVKDLFFDEPPYYLVLDHVEGGDLPAWCQARGGVENVPLDTRLEIVAQVAEALQAAHDAGVIHRDVKPSNILIASKERANSPSRQGISGPGPPTTGINVQARLTDFGIGQVVSQQALAGLTNLGFTQTMISPGSSSVIGTQMYMAPELIAGKRASPQSDIYSLGIVLYQLLVGDLARPLTTDWAREIRNPLLQEDLARCFAGHPERRFSNAGDLARNLRTLVKRQEVLLVQESALTELVQLQAGLSARRIRAFNLEIFRIASIVVLISIIVFLITAGGHSVGTVHLAERRIRHWYNLKYLQFEHRGFAALPFVESLEFTEPLDRIVTGAILENAGDLNAAQGKYTTAIESVRLMRRTSRNPYSGLIERQLLVKRSALYRKLNRDKEAAQDNVAAMRISPRDPSVGANQVDLSAYYNGGLGEDKQPSVLIRALPRGLQVPIRRHQLLNNTEFDVRGVVLLASTNTAWKDDDRFWPRPNSVSGIRISAKATRLHFLHAADWEDSSGSRIGTYRVNYVNNESIEIPIVYGRNIWRWFGEQPGTLDRAIVAWEGKRSDNEARAQLFKFTWENPLRDVAIETIDFISADALAAPCLVALTME